MLYFQAEHTLIIYVQFIIGSKRKNLTPFREIVREQFWYFVSHSIYKRLNLEYLSSETVEVKIYFLADCAFLETRLSNANSLLLNIIRNKWDMAISFLFK